MSEKNLSETLFDNHKQAKETSTLAVYMPSSEKMIEEKIKNSSSAWYRKLRRMLWAWQGIDPVDQEEVLARIASSDASRTHDNWLDTVIGYHSGNWTYEWNKLGAKYQQQSHGLEREAAANKLFAASVCYSIAGYPHLNNDSLAIQARALAVSAYEEAAEKTHYLVKKLEFPYKNKKIVAHLHVANTDEPRPVVILSCGLDALQTDMWRLFRDFLAKRNIAMLTIDMPSIGYNAHWRLTEDSSVLHQAVVNQLHTVPWIDHHRIGLIGFRFGGNAMARLAFVEQAKIKACVILAAPIHDILSSPEKIKSMPKMYLDVMASRISRSAIDINSLVARLKAWSLKAQGLVGSRKTQVPILAVTLENDVVSPYSDNKLVAMFSRHGQAKQITTKSLFTEYEETLNTAINWLQDELIK